MGDFAWVTLATNDSYSLGALVLAHSLKKCGTCHQLVLMVTDGVSDAMKEKLRSVYNLVHEVNILNSKDEENLLLLKRPELGITFTKLHCWRLTQYKKCVFLDADTLVLKNCDELFEREEFSAAPDVGWPDCFNSGVFVYQPSEVTYNSLMKFATEKGSFDGGDQGLLNLYFSDWAHKDIRKHLPFIYNMCSVASYSYLPALKQYGTDTKIIHFIGATKPWQQYYNAETSQVSVVPGLSHLRGVFQLWWSLFYSHVHSTLSPARTESRLFVLPPHIISSFQIEQNQHFTKRSEPSHIETISVVDLWDNYYPETHTNLESTNTNVESCYTLLEPSSTYLDTIHSELNHPHLEASSNAELLIFASKSQVVESNYFFPNEEVESCLNYDACVKNAETRTSFSQEACSTSTFEENVNIMQKSTKHNTIILQEPLVNSSYSQSLDVFPIPTNLNLAVGPYLFNNPCQSAIANVICDPDGDDAIVTNIITNELPTLTIKTPADTVSEPVTDKCEQLAGALTCPFESQFRRQGWESGQVDYLGTDSFDNVWKKICETLDSTSLESKNPTKQ